MRPYFLLFGDSITQYSFSTDLRGWGGLLADYYTAKVDIINRGFSGYTSRVATLLLDKVFPLGQKTDASVINPNPSLVTIFFGANDACHLPSAQHVPIEEYVENLRLIVGHVKKTCGNIVLITPPPFEHDMWKIFCEANEKPSTPRVPREVVETNEANQKPNTSLCRTNELAGAYAAKVVEVAAQTGVHCVDLWTTMQEEADWRAYLVDGLHLSHEGNGFLFRKLRELILNKISDLSPSKLDLYNNEGILWSEIDMENPRNSIKLN